jgi:hypothetical protein
MRWLTNAVLTATLLVGAIGCDKPVDPKVDSFIYPLAIGNRWTYNYQTITDYRSQKPDDTTTYSETVEVVRVDTILPGILSYALRASSNIPEWPGPPPERNYFNLTDGLYFRRSYIGVSTVLPKQPGTGPAVSFHGRQFQSLQALLTALAGLLWVEPAGQSSMADSFSLVLPYPQSRGQRWTSTPVGDDNPLGVDKLIAGGTTVKNSAGSFECHVIHWIHDPPMEDLSVDDFTSAQGLIQRRIEVRNLIMSDYQHPYGNGDTADAVSTYELTSFELH